MAIYGYDIYKQNIKNVLFIFFIFFFDSRYFGHYSDAFDRSSMFRFGKKKYGEFIKLMFYQMIVMEQYWIEKKAHPTFLLTRWITSPLRSAPWPLGSHWSRWSQRLAASQNKSAVTNNTSHAILAVILNQFVDIKENCKSKSHELFICCGFLTAIFHHTTFVDGFALEITSKHSSKTIGDLNPSSTRCREVKSNFMELV